MTWPRRSAIQDARGIGETGQRGRPGQALASGGTRGRQALGADFATGRGAEVSAPERPCPPCQSRPKR